MVGLRIDFSAATSPNYVRIAEPNHNECVACGRVVLGPSKLRAAAQGIGPIAVIKHCLR